MGEKDIAEKTLAAYNDVFADIVNVLLFDGGEVISPEKLSPAVTVSQYKADGKIHEQERDVSKYVNGSSAVVSLIGFENQTMAEKLMPVRVMSYDAQDYRAQLLGDKPEKIYPVVTLVLYFGSTHWNYSRRLKDCIDETDMTAQQLAPFASDYEMKNLFEIAFLSHDTVSKFRSDFRYVADYFVQMREKDDYVPDTEQIEHVDAVLKLMSVITGDRKFEEGIPFFKGKEGVSMESILDRVQNKGISIGRDQGITIGRDQGITIGRDQGYIQGEDDKAIIVYNNCLDRGMSEADAIAISEISENALEKARKQREAKE